MKKIITTLTIIAMLICSLNIGAVCAEPADNIEGQIESIEPIEALPKNELVDPENDKLLPQSINTYSDTYNVVQIKDRYVAINIQSRNVAIYVTDGYNPIAGAKVDLNGETVTSSADGKAYFENVPVSDEAYTIEVNSDEYGYNQATLFVSETEELGAETSELGDINFNISYWTEEIEQNYYAIQTYANTTGQWVTCREIGNSLQNGNKGVVSYKNKLYLFSDRAFYIYDIATDTWATQTSVNDKFYNALQYNGKIYIAARATAELSPVYINVYDISSAKWNSDIINAGSRTDCAFFECNGYIYIGPGRDYYYTYDEYVYEYIGNGTCVRYNTSTDKFEDVADTGRTDIYTSFGMSYGDRAFFCFDNTIYEADDGELRQLDNSDNLFDAQYGLWDYNESNGIIYFVDYDSTAYKTYDLKTETYSEGYLNCEFNASFESIKCIDENRILLLGKGNTTGTMKTYMYNLVDRTITELDELSQNRPILEYHNGMIYAIFNDGKMSKMVVPSVDTTSVTEKSSLISAGENHVLYVAANGKIYAKGNNEYGQLGTGNNVSRSTYTDISEMFDGKNVIKVETIYNASFAITEDNALYSWGSGTNYKLGTGTNSHQNKPIKILDNVADVQAGQYHTIAITKNGEVYGWGFAGYGALANQSTSFVTSPKLIYSDAKAIGVGDNQTFVIDFNNNLYATGINDDGQLGIGNTETQSSFVYVMSNITDVVGGSNHTVILDASGNMYVCGSNKQGQLANATSIGDNISTPTKIATASKIYAALNMTAYINSGVLYQCGAGIYPTSGNFVQIKNVENNSDITLNKDCYALTPSKVVKHWGLMTESSNLLTSSGNTTSVPEKLKLDAKFKVADTYRYQSLAIDSEDNVWAWGEGYYADGSDSVITHYYPTKISGLSNITQVERGKNHNLAVDTNGNVYGWGSNTNNVLGSDVGGKVKVATKINGISGVKMVSAGDDFSVFLKTDGTIWGVGNNSEKQLKNTDVNVYKTPTKLYDGNFDAIASSASKTIAMDKEGKLYSFGGNQDLTKINVTFTSGTGSKFKAIDAGDSHYLALTDEGYVYGWGNNSQGQLGKGDKITLDTVSLMKTSYSQALENINSIHAGYRQSFAISNDGKVYGCGSGTAYQLGLINTGTIQYATKINNFDGKNIYNIAAGHDFTIALGDDVYVVGNTRYGALGTYRTEAIID